MRVKLKDVCEKATSNLKQSDILSLGGKYPVYGASGYLGNIDSYHQDKPYIAVVKDGAGIGRTTILPPKSSVIGTMQYLIPKENVMPEYLYYVVKHMRLQKYYTGATIPHIYFKDYQNEEFNLADLNKQREIVKVLKNVDNTIRYQEIEINKFDELIKARFIEMFGDPITNSRSLSTNSLKDTLILKAGDFTEASNIFEEYSDVHPYPCYGGNGVRGFVSEYNQDGEYSLIGRQGALSGNVQFVAGKFKNTEHALLVTPLISMNSIWLNQLLIGLTDTLVTS